MCVCAHAQGDVELPEVPDEQLPEIPDQEPGVYSHSVAHTHMPYVRKYTKKECYYCKIINIT